MTVTYGSPDVPTNLKSDCGTEGMSDIKLFRVGNGAVDELQGRFVTVEKSLQVLIEKHLQALLGVRLLASEI